VTEPVMLTEAAVADALPWGDLIAQIEAVITDPKGESPDRTVHTVPVPGGADGTLLMKPAWVTGEVIGVKVVTVFPDNGAIDLPTIQSGFLLFDGRTGSLVGTCAANELTARRTAAASAVGAKRLSRVDARRLLIVGTGALAPMAARAHAFVRDYDTIEVWGRRPEKAAAIVAALVADGLPAEVCFDLDVGVGRADVISTSTGSTSPLVRGALLQPGTHVDLVGAFNGTMRESDDDVMARGSVFVDTRSDAVLAGDLAGPLAGGVLSIDGIRADLAELVSGAHPGRVSAEEITVFKSAGLALEDVAAAQLAFGR
jgi:alanine dehydrogenase